MNEITEIRESGQEARGIMTIAVIVDIVRTPPGKGKPGGALSGTVRREMGGSCQRYAGSNRGNGRR
jgi:hypothetical protein